MLPPPAMAMPNGSERPVDPPEICADGATLPVALIGYEVTLAAVLFAKNIVDWIKVDPGGGKTT
jgi:hypothetical protein